MHRQDMPGKTRKSIQVVSRVLRETGKGRRTWRNGGVCVCVIHHGSTSWWTGVVVSVHQSSLQQGSDFVEWIVNWFTVAFVPWLHSFMLTALFLHSSLSPLLSLTSVFPSLFRIVLQRSYWLRMQMDPRLLARHDRGGELSVEVWWQRSRPPAMSRRYTGQRTSHLASSQAPSSGEERRGDRDMHNMPA